MSEKPITSHVEETGNGGLRFIFDESVALDNGDGIDMKWSISNAKVIVEATILRNAPSSSVTVVPRWIIEYDNDTGPDDDGFAEWWIVTDGEKDFKCRKESDAEWLCDVLNAYASPL